MRIPLLFPALLLSTGCNLPAPGAASAQTDAAFYACEGCEAVHERPSDDLDWRITIPPEREPGEPLVLYGRVFHSDGRTPAPGIVLYLHHTDADGVYPRRGDEAGWARRHGYLRGWLRTDADGRYEVRTIRPGSYPGREDPAHIHITVEEPGRRAYWINDVLFDDDPLLTPAHRMQDPGRGGNGVVRLTRGEDGVWQGARDITLAP